MKTKPRKSAVRAPTITYLECEMVPITDPREQAMVDRLFRKADKILAAQMDGKKARPRKRK